jgi:hypothetical protein
VVEVEGQFGEVNWERVLSKRCSSEGISWSFELCFRDLAM